jgi:Predicted metal-binding integral membrane protein (DUF2182)
MVSERSSECTFFGVSALLFAASAAVTIVWCASMAVMGNMPMPGGWTMSMAWMRMPGQTTPAAGASFLGMWVVMMAAMMLPSLVPMLWRYRQAVGSTGETHTDRIYHKTTVVLREYDALCCSSMMGVRRWGDGLQGRAFRETDYPMGGEMVRRISDLLSAARGNDGRARSISRSLHPQPLGYQICPEN